MFCRLLTAHSISWPLWVVILGHTPILEFIDVLQTSLITQSISWSLRVIISGYTPFSASTTGACPLSLGLPCLVLISWLSDPFVDLYELSPRASLYHRLVSGIPLLSSYLGHPPSFSYFTIIDFHLWAFVLVITTIDFHLWAFQLFHHHGFSSLGFRDYHHHRFFIYGHFSFSPP